MSPKTQRSLRLSLSGGLSGFALAILTVILAFQFTLAAGYRILAILPHTGKSHFDFFEPLVKELALKGHSVTVLSHFPQKTRVANYTDVSLAGTVPVLELTVKQVEHLNPVADFHAIHTIGLQSCQPILSSKQVQDFIEKDQHFDVILTEVFTTDCFLGFVYRFNAPFVGLASSTLFSFSNDRFGNPANPAHIPNTFLPYGSRMTFTERLFNVLTNFYMSFARSYYYDSPAQWIAKKHFGRKMPSLEKIAKNTSLVLLNNHFSLSRPRPNVPAVIEVGGLHIRPAKKLPKDIEKFLNGAKDGVIVFSMGSMLQSRSLPERRLKAFLLAFAELPQRVLWKYENETLADQPPNVMISSWIPQRDVLEHPNVKLFITHGGMLGLSEAVFCGVPILGIPMFGDQPSNVQAAVEAGIGELFPYYRTPYMMSIVQAIRQILNNERYTENAKRLSAIYRDRPLPPLDTATYWVEYVARHGGAHLRSPTVDLSTAEYLLLDVAVFILAAVAALAFAFYKIYSNIEILPYLKMFLDKKSKKE
uniref:UDP-glucuronosyltransferase n=1 Tax=Trialeurodes vaporariorum TaxID=88556 RepID=A0A873P511_TRIVP|nr:UDP-gluconosyltransferase [Trialeurodes vaporariorum]